MKSKYLIVFGREYSSHEHGHYFDRPVLIAACFSEAEAKARRKISGDVVLHAETGQIVKETWWLWEWELQRDCYAKRAIAQDMKWIRNEGKFEHVDGNLSP